MIHVNIYVKFRAFGITFSEFRDQWAVSLNGTAIVYHREEVSTPPAGNKKMLDRNGVKLVVWAE